MFYSELMEKLDGCHNLKRDSTLAFFLLTEVTNKK